MLAGIWDELARHGPATSAGIVSMLGMNVQAALKPGMHQAPLTMLCLAYAGGATSRLQQKCPRRKRRTALKS